MAQEMARKFVALDFLQFKFQRYGSLYFVKRIKVRERCILCIQGISGVAGAGVLERKNRGAEHLYEVFSG